jgi:hypothetical protein
MAPPLSGSSYYGCLTVVAIVVVLGVVVADSVGAHVWLKKAPPLPWLDLISAFFASPLLNPI